MGKLTLYPNQAEQVARWMREPTKSILDGSPMSAGKTVMSVTFCLNMGFTRVLIIGIKDTFEQWRSRTQEQSDFFVDIRRIDATKKGQANMAGYLNGDAGWFFIGQQYLTAKDWGWKTNPDGTLKTKRVKKTIKGIEQFVDEKQRERLKTWDAVNPDIIVYDEVHAAANSRTSNWKTLLPMQAEWRLALSGTFYGNKFENAYGPARWLWRDLIPASPYVWRSQWCEEKTLYLEGGKTTKQVVGEKHPGQFVASLPCYTQLGEMEDAPEPEIVTVELKPEQRRVYNDLEQHMITWFNDHPFAVEFPIALRGHLRTTTLATPSVDPETGEIFIADDAESTKMDALFPILEQKWKGQNVVMLTDSKRFTKYAVRRMLKRGMRVAEYSGDLSTKQRDEVKRQWLEGELDYIFATSAFSVGLDAFQLVCNKIVWMSKFDSLKDNLQAVHRIFRNGPMKDGFEHIYISANDTYDSSQYSSLELQQIAQKMTLKKS